MKISVYNDWDHIPKAEKQGQDQVVLTWDGEYRKGDIIEFSDLVPGTFYMVRADAALEEAFVLIKKDQVLFPVPFYERKTSYNPLCFFGNRHIVSIRKAETFEINAFKNLALNPFDQHDVDYVFPHASANVETRNEAVFEARNAIDGCLACTSHGEWPYESWGINRQDDALFRLDFGRKVDIHEIRLYTRADFPHDNWWVSGRIRFSDGSDLPLKMGKLVDTPHVFSGLDKKDITWLTLSDLIKADDPSPFPALTQIQVFGKEAACRGK